jgi:hypothetical protein
MSLASADAKSEASVKLLSSEGKEFVVPRSYAFISPYVTNAVDENPKSDTVPLPFACTGTLTLVVEYMQEHKGVEPVLPVAALDDADMKNLKLQPWDKNFIDRVATDWPMLAELAVVSSQMRIDALECMCCAKIAALMFGEPIDSIAEKFSGESAGRTAASSSASSSSSGPPSKRLKKG